MLQQRSLYNSGEEYTTRPSSTALLVLDSNDRAYYNPLPVWSAGNNYITGNEVYYDTEVYICISAVRSSVPPDSDTTHWSQVDFSLYYNYTTGGESNGNLIAGTIGNDNSVGQPYNNFRIQKTQPLLQGGFSRITVAEVNWNWNIPNVNDYTNYFWIVAFNTSTEALVIQKIVVPNGYYTGSALASAIQTAVNTAFASSGLTITVTFNASLGFTLSGGGSPNAFIALYAYNPDLTPPANVGTTLLDVMGFNPRTNWTYCATKTLTKTSVGASLLYTTFIDIVSNKLTFYQKVSDQNSRRNGGSNVICRLYITDNTALPNQFSPLPYVITRQFNNAKQIRWDKNTAIDWCDIQLLDDSGRPLYYNAQTAMSGDFQITLLASED